MVTWHTIIRGAVMKHTRRGSLRAPSRKFEPGIGPETKQERAGTTWSLYHLR
jgi:hypothetical protein